MHDWGAEGRGLMKVTGMLLASAIAFAGSAVASPMPLTEAAKLFGSRPDSFAADLSPSGDRVAYLSAIGGAKTAVDVLDIATGKTTRLTTSDGRQASLTSCEFASDTMLIWMGKQHLGQTEGPHITISPI